MLPIEKYQSIIGNLQNVIWTDQLPLNECLEAADFIVAVNSSVIFDALLYKKPVLSLGESILSNKNILYEYCPHNFESVLKEFYALSNLKYKHENFKNILEFLFRENLVFIKNKLNSEIFARKLISLKKDNKNSNDIFEHNYVIEKYFKEGRAIKEDYYVKLTFKDKIKKRIKCYFTKILLKR